MSRNCSVWLVTFLGLSLGATGNAQDQEQPSSSQTMRRADHLSVLWQPFGIGEGILLGGRVEYAQTADRRLGLLVQVGREVSDLWDDYSAHGQLVGLYAKEFFANSFYLEGALGWHRRWVKIRSAELDYTSDRGLHVKATEMKERTYRDIGAQLALGNQWQWQNFTIGCEWVGLYAPLVDLKSEEKRTRIGSDGQIEPLASSDSKLKGKLTLRLLNSFIGWQF